jgi:hypothetical protein
MRTRHALALLATVRRPTLELHESHEVGARMGAHFARGCSVVLGCARPCSILTCADERSRRSGEWW